jgi:hypothetical protein
MGLWDFGDFGYESQSIGILGLRGTSGTLGIYRVVQKCIELIFNVCRVSIDGDTVSI